VTYAGQLRRLRRGKGVKGEKESPQPLPHRSLPAKFFAPKIKNKKKTRLAQPTHPRVKKVLPKNEK